MDKYHLTSDGEQWKLTRSGAQRASKVFGDATKQEAVQEAAKFMHQHGGSMRIHKESGGIQEERTYPRSADPKRSPG